MFLILLSSCVSLITLLILFFRVKNSKKRTIPSWFLGKKNKIIINNNIIFKKPPFIPFILILIVTTCFAYLYHPKESPKSSDLQSSSSLIWLDPSFSSKISRSADNFDANEEAEKILSFGFNNFGLETNFIIKNGIPEVNYKIISLKSKTDIKDFLEKENNKPTSPFHQSIHTEKINKLLKESPFFSEHKSRIIILSDGKFESLQGVLSLKKFFNFGSLKKSSPFQMSKENEIEIIPKELSLLWNEQSESSGQFIEFNSKLSNIPEEARPHFFINTIHSGDNAYKFLTSKKTKNELPLFIVCTDRFPGTIELDPFSSLRSLVNFFNNEFIEKSCIDNQLENIETSNAWKFRNPALWVVPLTEQIISLMNNDFKFWTPIGFDSNYDTLIYVGSANLNNETFEIKKSPVQLDTGTYPIPIYLLPPPPSAEIGHKIYGENLEYKGKFKTFFNAPDGTPLAWKTSSLPFFYLRTTTATPNGELGRSRRWTDFWFEVARTVKKSNLAFTKMTLDDVNKLQDSFEEAGISNINKFSEILDLKTLNFKISDNFTSGLYKIENGKNWILVNTVENESNQIYMTPEEFSQKFSGVTSIVKDKKEQKNTSQLLNMSIAILCTILLFWLWKKPIKSSLFFIIFFISFSTMNKIWAENFEEREQNSFSMPMFYNGKMPVHNVDPENIPFKIAWCAKDIPKNVEENYAKFRNVLIRRGTINLPKNLKADSCKSGEAEIWWTDNLSILSRKSLIEHISNGGIFIIEGAKSFPPMLSELTDLGTGIDWESPPKRGMFYRSFYLLQTLNGCLNDSTKVLMLKKKINAQAPFALITDARFFSSGEDCFKNNSDYKIRSFINIMYSFLTTDYKEDQLQLPEILNRIRNLGLEP
ncbi:hypothetical protein [Fluviispira multicolorata]|uniref:Uncharacterized protein n=1 Tax=Fluviispira multicolorata TaxID=2654512 RepID=A0A833JI88_9BACT|nr:hypothetical protein [Fluviispira multicolorata]KAB8033767.1 hypothetical protein GCL57_03405 [Fluviispira multicolorata]